jgi:hypothetical protein
MQSSFVASQHLELSAFVEETSSEMARDDTGVVTDEDSNASQMNVHSHSMSLQPQYGTTAASQTDTGYHSNIMQSVGLCTSVNGLCSSAVAPLVAGHQTCSASRRETDHADMSVDFILANGDSDLLKNCIDDR